MKLMKPSATTKVCVSSSWSYSLRLHSVCLGLCSLSLLEELILYCSLGWYTASDLGRMRMTSGECPSILNMTYLFVCRHTIPLLPACAGWDEVTITWQPMGKSVGQFEPGAGCSVI